MSGAKTLLLAGLLVVALTIAAFFIPSQWEGVDVAIVQTKAEELGGKVSPPLLNLTGDFQLFVFTVAGFAGGAIVGYNWRTLFGREAVEAAKRRSVQAGAEKES